MHTDKEEPLYKAESHQIVGSAMEVLNEIRHGFHEKPYENALASAGLHPKRQARKAGMETSRPMNLSVSISVHQWLKTKSQQGGVANTDSAPVVPPFAPSE